MGRLARGGASAGVAGFIVPDLPLDESASCAPRSSRSELALVQMVTPVTEPQRLRAAVRGQPGLRLRRHHDRHHRQKRRRARGASSAISIACARARALPVCAGFGIRSREQVERLRGHVDGVVVGSALVEVLERGEDPTAWLEALRP